MNGTGCGHRCRDGLPLATLALLLAVLGLAIFGRVSLSGQPPFVDGLEYVQKAKNFWEAVQQFSFSDPRTWANPLNLRPTFRPPGTVLLSSPFGFEPNPHGFHFRSVFVPIVLFVAAVWIVAVPCGREPKDRWLLVALCLALATLPLFYHYEAGVNGDVSSPVVWGLVDNFLAGVAALAVSLVVRGSQQGSVTLTRLGIAVAGFSLFVKPAGALVMIAVLLAWAVHVWWQYGRGAAVRRYLWIGLGDFLCVYTVVLLLALTSEYLSRTNIAYGKAGLDVGQKTGQPGWLSVLSFVHATFGWHWLLLWLTICVLSFRHPGGRGAGGDRSRTDMAGVVAGAGVLVPGLWLWLFASGREQIRFFAPFGLMAITLVAPRLLTFGMAVGRRYVAAIVLAVVLGPFGLLVALNASKSPPVGVQRALGINLTSGSLRAEVAQAKALLALAGERGHALSVVGLSTEWPVEVFLAVLVYERMLRGDLDRLHVTTPADWERGRTFRLADLVASDYVVFSPVRDPERVDEIRARAELPDFAAESELMHAWWSGAGREAGVEVQSETSLRVVKIADRARLARQLDALHARYDWTQVFQEANPSKWIDGATASRLLAGSPEEFREVRFGDAFRLRGLITAREEEDLRVEFVWESLRKQALDYVNFVHLVDGAGNILRQADYEQDIARRVVDRGTLWHDVVRIPVKGLKGASRLAIGVYRPPDTFITTAHPSSDWEGRRLLIDLGPE